MATEKTSSYPEIVPLGALIACNAMNWPGGTAIYFSHKIHHWLMLYTFGQYIVNVQWSITGDRFLTIFKFGIRIVKCERTLEAAVSMHRYALWKVHIHLIHHTIPYFFNNAIQEETCRFGRLSDVPSENVMFTLQFNNIKASSSLSVGKGSDKNTIGWKRHFEGNVWR